MDRIRDFFDIFKESLIMASDLKEISSEMNFDITIPEKKEHGDVSTNIAFKLSSYLKKPPLKIANEIINSINLRELNISRVQVVNPGFINFFLDDNYIKILGDMVLKNGIKIIDEDLDKKILLIVDNSNSSINNKYRIQSYGNILKNILEIKGFKIELSSKEKILTKQYEQYILITSEKNDNKLDSSLYNEIIKVRDMVLTQDGNEVDKLIDNSLNFSQISFWSITKPYKNKAYIPLDIAFLNNTTNPYFYVTYVLNRVTNMVDILEREGYNIDDIDKMGVCINIEESRELIFKIIEFEKVLNEAVHHKEPYKILDYLNSLCDLFYLYNDKLLLRQQSKQNIITNLYILKVLKRFFNEILELLNIKN